jgi:hypothetical protein
MNILHCVHDHSLEHLNIFETANQAYCASLDQNVALSKKLQSFKSIAIGANESLSSLDKPFFVSDERSDLDNLAEHTVLHDSQGLLVRHTSTD